MVCDEYVKVGYFTASEGVCEIHSLDHALCLVVLIVLQLLANLGVWFEIGFCND